MWGGKFYGKRLTPVKASLQEKLNADELTAPHLAARIARCSSSACMPDALMVIAGAKHGLHFTFEFAESK